MVFTKYKLTTEKTIVIVESPAKCKKIESFLGPGYKVIASFGHLREISSLKNIDIHNGFQPTYEIMDDPKKKTHIEFMRKDIAQATEVLLATDDDREGESIAWHICMLFGLPVETTKRIVFHEITESAIQEAMLHPTVINMNIVFSQQARQVLDLLVGFTITPLLWKYISNHSEKGLSAGRCQTPALKLIYENDQDIKNHPGKCVFNVTGYFTKQILPFSLNKKIEEDENVMHFLEETVNHDHIFSCSKPTKIFKQPPEPLTTSRIQQLASNEMHISPKETMRICQVLYEAGYITYMRTDSKKYSGEFIETVKKWILSEYLNERYIHNQLVHHMEQKINPKESKIKQKNPLVQEAHESIRPTHISVKNIDDTMEPREKKLYKLIWENTLESCMAPAEYFSITAQITSPDSLHYTYSCENADFLGWKIVKHKGTHNNSHSNNNTNNQDSKEYNYLQTVKPGPIEYKKITCLKTIVDKKQHYTEAKLVQLLEEKGIGRPSTFSMLTEKIQERGYVVKEDIPGQKIQCIDYELEDDTITEKKTAREIGGEKGKLVIQPLGVIVMDFIEKHFSELFQYDYTRYMEEELDIISKGEKVWNLLCATCFSQINILCDTLKTETRKEIKIDEHHVYMIGKYGPVVKCVEIDPSSSKETITFKQIKKDMDIDIQKLEAGEYTLEQIVEMNDSSKKTVLGMYQGYELLLKKGRFGLYVTWGNSKKSLSCFGNRPIENIKYEDVLSLLNKESNTTNHTDNEEPDELQPQQPQYSMIRKITESIHIRDGPHGDYIFYKNKKMKHPKFFKLDGFTGDYKTCGIDLLKKWIVNTYKIRV